MNVRSSCKKFAVILGAFMLEVAQAANFPGGNACYDWGYGDKALLGSQHWAPSDMKVTFSSTDIPNEKKMHIEFSFDENPALYKGWGLRSIMNGKMYYYPFGLEVKLVLPSASGVRWTGDERGTDWRSWSSGASAGESDQPGVPVLPGAVLDVFIDPTITMGLGLT